MTDNNETTHSTDRPYVLVVEDSPTTRVVIERHLKQYFDLITAADGQEAWDLLQNDDKIELVITDINMPRMSGIELLQHIRSAGEERIASLPVFIMTSADDDERDKHQALDLGANDFITKPINPIVLRARVNVHHRLAKATQRLNETKSETGGTDSASNLKTREAFRLAAKHEFDVARNGDSALSLILFDIDLFDEVSDAYGISGTSKVVGCVSDQLERVLRGIDVGAYLGDGSYGVLLPGTRRLGSAVVAERLRAAIEKLEIDIDGNTASITASVALACIPAEDVTTMDELIVLCEKRLASAHEQGHNRICVNNDGHNSFSRN